MRLRLAAVLALLAAAWLPLAAQAQLRRQPAGACEVLAPVPEDPGLHWDYWWSGACADGLASGPGFLLQSMRGGGFGDVYEARLVQGRLDGEVRVYGSLFLGTEWTQRVVRMDAEGEAADPGPDAARLPRFALPLALQAALDRFAREVGHPQMPALPLPAQPLHCPAFVDEDGRPAAQGPGTEVAAFIRAHGGAEAARRDALLQALQAFPAAAGKATVDAVPGPATTALAAGAAQPGPAPGPREARRRLALATAVAGCAQQATGWGAAPGP